MGRLKGIDLTEQFFEECREYLAGKKSMTACAKALKKAPNTFISWLAEAYSQGYLSLATKNDDGTKNLLISYVNSTLRKVINANVAAGHPDNQMFALFAAECVIYVLRRLLTDKSKDTISIGVVSGTSTGETINNIVVSRIWDDIVSEKDLKPKNKKINVIALNIPPTHGRELYGNAIASVVALSRFLREKLPPECQVIPYGLTSPLVVDTEERAKNDETNSDALKIVDPTRIRDKNQKSKRSTAKDRTHLDVVIAGVGSTESSVFTQAISFANIDAPTNMVGDVSYIPVDKNGKPLKLKRKNSNEEVFIYSLLSANVMQDLVNDNKDVILVARNSRLFGKDEMQLDRPDKTQSIKAAILGGFCNFLITDRDTANAIINST